MDILFDIGNVIVDVDFAPALQRLMEPGADDVKQRLDTLLERKDEFEAGRITAEEFFPWAADILGFEGSQEKLLDAWVDIFSPNPPMWQCIGELQSAGHRLILFSNTNRAHKEFLFAQYPVFQCFTGGVFSYQTGHIKPEPDIYQIAIRQYGLTPGKTLYIDDLPANINAGQRAGFICHSYSVDKHDTFLTWLGAML